MRKGRIGANTASNTDNDTEVYNLLRYGLVKPKTLFNNTELNILFSEGPFFMS